MAMGVSRYVLVCAGCALLEYFASLEAASVVGNLHLMETSHEEIPHRIFMDAVSPLKAADEPSLGVPPEAPRPR